MYLFLLLPAPKLLGSSFYSYFIEISLIMTWGGFFNYSFYWVLNGPFQAIYLCPLICRIFCVISLIVSPFPVFLFSPFGTPATFMLDLLIDIHIFLSFPCNFPPCLFYFLEEFLNFIINPFY